MDDKYKKYKFFIILVFILNYGAPASGINPDYLKNAHKSLRNQDDRLNIVLIVADDLGWTDLGFTGSDLHETPNLDQLAAQNMYFSNFYAASPVCSPTRASILTGKYPARLHITTHYENSGDYWRNFSRDDKNPDQKLQQPTTVGNLPKSETTIAEFLKVRGYFTAHIGKWHLGNFEHYPENQGFDVNIGGTAWGAPDTYWYPWTGQNFQRQLRYIPGLILGAEEGAYLPDRLTDKALEIIDQKKNAPFFLHLNFYIPHTPIEGKSELSSHFKKKVKSGMKHKNYVYAAMIKSLDENIGRILTRIDETGLADNTVVIFLSDNGGRVGQFQQWETVANNAPLRSGKGSLYEGGIRVPLIIKWPGITENKVDCDFPVISNDLYPTIVEIVQGENNAGMENIDGLSMVPLLKDPNAGMNREMIYWHYPHYYSTTTPASAVRKGKWKLIHYFDDNVMELYNLEDDIGEKEDLIHTYPEIADKLMKMLQDWRQGVNAQYPAYNPYFMPEMW